MIDSCGRIVERGLYTLLSYMIVMKSYKNARIYAHSSAPSGAEKLAEQYGAVIVRTRSSPPELMPELTKNGGDELFDQFIYAFDAVGALIKLCDFMKSENASLSELIARLPETHMVHTDVSCAQKSKALEQMLERHSDAAPDASDGLKLSFDRGWVLLMPSENGNYLNLTSQGFSEEYARELADMCIEELHDLEADQ